MGRKQRLQPLKMLDLAKCRTVSDIVAGMANCSFGARMLGEAAAVWANWCREGTFPIVIIDDDERFSDDIRLFESLRQFIGGRIHVDHLRWPDCESARVLAIGRLRKRTLRALSSREPGTTLFINDVGEAPNHRDGHFPNAVFGDVDYILAVLTATLEERILGKTRLVGGLISCLERGSTVSHSIWRAASTLRAQVQDADCTRFLTLSGAMTVAQMSLVICEMIDRGFVHSVTSTGALMAHGLVPGLGLKHYKYDPEVGDDKLAKKGLNRVTDTLEPETNFDHIDEIMREVLEGISGEKAIGSYELNRSIGEHLDKNYGQHRAILLSALRNNVPVFVPASIDSELGNDIYVTNVERGMEGRLEVIIDHDLDNRKLIELMVSRKRSGIMSWGGGVPRNWTQNVAPLIEIYNNRLRRRDKRIPVRQFSYGVRVCPDKPFYGHLSGCTYSEGTSWRKMDPKGIFAEILSDATIVWPFLVKHLMDLQDQGAIPKPAK